MTGPAFYILSALWAAGIVGVFIQAIRLSYSIEARSPDLANKTGLPMRAQIVHTVTNWKVARDAETQALRRRMNILLVICVFGLVVMAASVNWVKPEV